MKSKHFGIALLITLVLAGGVTVRALYSSSSAQLQELRDQLRRTQADLTQARLQLADANDKLSFIETTKARVQVTAYALTDDFGPDPLFANNTPARGAYAVPRHSLPPGKVLNVALSPLAERKLHAKLNDTLVLVRSNNRSQYLARFVDRTAQTETRPVVDVLFADAHQARLWGRQSFYAVNLSRSDSPFRQE